MKTFNRWLIVVFLGCALMSVYSQESRRRTAPEDSSYSGNYAPLFGENRFFSAIMTNETTRTSDGATATQFSKYFFSAGKTRTEIDSSLRKGFMSSPETASHLKAAGLHEMIAIDQQTSGGRYVIFPLLKSYVPQPDNAPIDESRIKMRVTELGKDIVDGHPCVKNKVVLTDPNGVSEELTVWNATDLKQFPIRYEIERNEAKVVTSFSAVILDKPDPKLFEPPDGFKRYESVSALTQSIAAKTIPDAPKKIESSSGGASGPVNFSGTFSKLFDENRFFSATMTAELIRLSDGASTTIITKMDYADRKSRAEMDATRNKGFKFPPDRIAMLKASGMSPMIGINDPTTATSYSIFPALKAYIQEPDAASIDESKITMRVTELAKETVGGHECVKNKVVLTDPSGGSDEAVVWNATDLNRFPIRFEISNSAGKIVVTFGDLVLQKPAAKLFELPVGFKRFENMSALMEEMAAKFGPDAGKKD